MTDLLNRQGSQQELADLIGVSEARVSQLVASGVVDRDDTLRVQLLAYCSWVREVAAGRSSTQGGGPDLVFERAMLARHQAGMASLRLAEMKGDVIRVEAVKQAFAIAFTNARDALLQLPARLAPALAVELDQSEVHNLLDAEIRDTLHQLAATKLAAGIPAHPANDEACG